MGVIRRHEKAAALEGRFCPNLDEPAPASHGQQVRPNRGLVSQLDSVPELERETRSESSLRSLRFV